jgi:tRNA(Ile)-lysidine synthase
MIQRLIHFITENKIFDKSHKILVGVSGGIDSVVLLDLLDKAGYSMAIAHCNFQLRGAESDKDERLVHALALKYDVSIFKIAFDTLAIATERKISIEMAARDLRYEWFEKIRSENNCDFIAVAHHRDDQLETFFLNLARGTGLAGLTGMNPVNGKVVRPLLFASRGEIENYRHELFLDFRMDATNQNLEFQRNKIRHSLMPIMDSLNPNFREGLIRTMDHLDKTASIYNRTITEAWQRVATTKDQTHYISIEAVQNLDPLDTYLFEFLKPFGFKGSNIRDIVQSLSGLSGKQFTSATHRLLHDRENLVLTPFMEEEVSHFYLDQEQNEISDPIHLKISKEMSNGTIHYTDSQSEASIDQDKIQFPLLIRRWQQGDYFKPLGMTGLKKLSDYFVDSKLSILEKENVWILANGEQIVWIIGYRLDDRYKITSQTKRIVKIKAVV